MSSPANLPSCVSVTCVLCGHDLSSRVEVVLVRHVDVVLEPGRAPLVTTETLAEEATVWCPQCRWHSPITSYNVALLNQVEDAL